MLVQFKDVGFTKKQEEVTKLIIDLVQENFKPLAACSLLESMSISIKINFFLANEKDVPTKELLKRHKEKFLMTLEHLKDK